MSVNWITIGADILTNGDIPQIIPRVCYNNQQYKFRKSLFQGVKLIKWQYFSIGSDDGLALNTRQAIAWSKVNPDLRRPIASLGHNEFIQPATNHYHPKQHVTHRIPAKLQKHQFGTQNQYWSMGEVTCAEIGNKNRVMKRNACLISKLTRRPDKILIQMMICHRITRSIKA